MEGRGKLADSEEYKMDIPFERMIDTEVEIHRQDQPLSFQLNALALAMGTVGLSSALLYLQPGMICAQDPDCAKPLSDQVGSLMATILLVACGSADFSAMNAYFGYDGVLQLDRILKRETNTIKKFVIASSIFLFAAFENSITLGISVASKAPNYVAALAWLGAYPGMFYAAISIKEKDLPYLKNATSTALNKIYLNHHKNTLTYAERELAGHIHQQAIFKKQLHGNWLSLLKRLDTLELTEQDDLLVLLMRENAEIIEESGLTKGLRCASQSIGFLLAAHLVGTLYLQFFMLAKKMWVSDSDTEAALLTGTVGALVGYLIMKVNINSFTALFNGLHQLSIGQPIDWLAMKLHPAKTLLAGTMGLLTAILSHATFVSTFNRVYEGPEKSILRNGVFLAVDLYHFFGILKLYNLWEKKHPKNANEKALYSLQNKIERLDSLSLKEFVAFSGDRPDLSLNGRSMWQSGFTLWSSAPPLKEPEPVLEAAPRRRSTTCTIL